MTPQGLDSAERALLRATQGGLPLTPRPYHDIAAALGVEPELVMRQLRDLLARGVIRRIGAVPNHYALGFRANAMSVWDIADDAVDEIGRRVGALPGVSHCYRRPRHLPLWPYNLFAMLHGRNRDEVEAQATSIAAMLGEAVRSHTMLFSTRILKKTGLRLQG